MTKPDPIHPQHCSCTRCHSGPAHRRRVMIERRLIGGALLLIAAFPGRWVAEALIRSLSH